jgi:hypothetical protein
VKNLSKQQTLQKPKLVQLDKVLYKRSTVIHSEGKLMTGPMVIEKARCFYDEIKMTDKCTFADSYLQHFKKCHGIRKLDISGELLSAHVEGAVTKK